MQVKRAQFGRPLKALRGGGLLAWPGRVGRELDDEVGVGGCADSFQERGRGHGAAGVQAREGRLGHVSPSGQFDLGQSQGKTAVPDRLADQECPARFGVAFPVLAAVTAPGGEFLSALRDSGNTVSKITFRHGASQ